MSTALLVSTGLLIYQAALVGLNISLHQYGVAAFCAILTIPVVVTFVKESLK